MRKFLPLLMLAFVSLFIFSCDNNDNEDVVVTEDTYATAYDIAPTFSRSTSNLYQFSDEFNSPLVESDVVLIYMQTGVANGSPIWRLLPYTFFVDNATNDEVDYSFDFSKFDIQINVNSTPTLNLDSNSTYYAGKRFRVVVVPAKTGKSSVNNVDHNDYNAVVKYYGIDEAKIKLKN